MAFKGTEIVRSKNAVVTLSTKRLAKLLDPRKVVNKATKAALARDIKKESLELVAVGKSPVKNKGRYRAYAAQRRGKGRYPETAAVRKRHPSKRTRPVNLELAAGKPYLNSLFNFKGINGGIRFLEPASKFMKILFSVHNEGARKDIPQRKVVPTNNGDYVAGIRKIIKNIYSRRIRSIIKSNG